MKHISIKRVAVAALAVLVAVSAAFPGGVVSAETEATDGSSSAMSVSPEKTYEIDPGKSVDDTLTVRNVDTSSDLNLTLRVVDFTYDESQQGVAKFNLDETAEPTPWSLRSHIDLPETVTIPAGQSKKIDMKVSIPQNQGAGSLYSAIIYSSASGGSDSTTNVGLSASMATLVFANVPGKVNEDLRLTKTGTYDKFDRKYTGWINITMPQSIGYTLENKGNWVEVPTGMITITGWFGKKVQIDNINPTKGRVLIGQTRTYSSCIKYDEKEVADTKSNTPPVTCVDPGLWPGYYKVTVDLLYGANGNVTQEITKTAGFWYLPWWFLALVVAVVAAGWWYGRKAYYKVRNHFFGPRVGGKSRSSRRR